MEQYTHDELSVKASAFINARATKTGLRVGYEISVAPGYVADVVCLGNWGMAQCEEWGIIGPTVQVPHPNPAYKGQTMGTREWFPELPSLVFIAEAKATRSDFLSTFNNSDHHANRKHPIGSMHWVVANEGVVLNPEEELPSFWGLLIPRGRGLVEVKRPLWKEEADAIDVMYQVGYEMLWQREWKGRMYDRLMVMSAEIMNAGEASDG